MEANDMYNKTVADVLSLNFRQEPRDHPAVFGVIDIYCELKWMYYNVKELHYICS